MKNGKKPTYKQKLILQKNRYVPDNWLVIKAPPGELHIQNKDSKKVRVLKVS